jgi:hypothetical protein
MEDVAGPPLSQGPSPHEPVDALVAEALRRARVLEEVDQKLYQNILNYDGHVAKEAHLLIALADALAKAQPVKGGEEKGYDPKVHVPGVWRCAKCNFQLIQSTLNANSGAITARDEPSSCPNDGSPMWRVTWKEHAEEAYQRYEERLEEFAASRARVEVLEAALADFNQAAKAEPIMSGRGEGTKKREPLNSEPFDFPQLITWGMMRRAQAALTEDKPHGG